ncbi:phosphoenolpyruvate carboxylase 4 [Canna indica]|uniref:Phosphoenolpyruvate carboxylase 4 n=1 Tax=Canna indica TaxID=4628 RepID=A0AAQ3KYT5_9LILI|nr:phosphoenolpyruvate carboxylase 4 [Canna indica]
MAIDLYIREIDNLIFELSMNRCCDTLGKLAHEILLKESENEKSHSESWNSSTNCSHTKHHNEHIYALPAQLPAGAYLPACTDVGLDIPHIDKRSDKRFVDFKKDEKQLVAEVHRKYVFGGHIASYMRVR